MIPQKRFRAPRAEQPAAPDPSRVDPDEEPTSETNGRSSDDTVWAFDDLDATWWDDVWPFRDDTAAELETAEPAVVETPARPAAPDRPAADEDAVLPAPWAASRASRESRWWTRRFVWVSAVAVAAFVVAGLLVLGQGQGHDDDVVLLKSRTYSSPVTLQPGTSYVRSRVLPSGDLLVTHWVRTRGPVDSLEVQTPPTLGLAAGSAVANHVVLAVDGTRYPVGAPASTAGSAPLTLSFPAAHYLFVQYRLTGAVQTTGPGKRAPARLTALDLVAGSGTVQTTQVVTGAKVLGLACTSGPADSGPVPCGSADGGTWSVRMTTGLEPTRVMAQLELP